MGRVRPLPTHSVASSANGVTLNIFLDGKPDGTVYVKADQLYNIIQGSSYGTHTLEIQVEGPGLDAYTFTFG